MEDQTPIRERILGYHYSDQRDPMGYMMSVQIVNDVMDPGRPGENQKNKIVLAQHADFSRSAWRTWFTSVLSDLN